MSTKFSIELGHEMRGPSRREFRWFGLLLKVIDTVTLSIIKFSILILAQIVENRESRQTGQIAGPRLPAVLYEDLFSSYLFE
jgi:hypothetical protein